MVLKKTRNAVCLTGAILAGFMLSIGGVADQPLFAPAYGQFSQGYQFLKAVKDRDGAKVQEMTSEPGGSTIVNTRDLTSGETALHIVVARRDTAWVRFLLQKGANPNLRDKKGVSPLMLAVTLGGVDMAEALLSNNAKVDLTNDSGETPLILAVHFRDVPMIRLLLKNGANPDQVDSLAGLSARDYARRDSRNNAIIDAITQADSERKAKASSTQIYGPEL